MESYQWCKSNDLKLLMFDSQDEQDKFLEKWFQQVNVLFSKLLSPARLGFFLGAYSPSVPVDPVGFIWYETGRSVTGPVNLKWYPGDPNDRDGTELCTAVTYDGGTDGIYDIPCNDKSLIVNFVCQETKNLRKGFKRKYWKF